MSSVVRVPGRQPRTLLPARVRRLSPPARARPARGRALARVATERRHRGGGASTVEAPDSPRGKPRVPKRTTRLRSAKADSSSGRTAPTDRGDGGFLRARGRLPEWAPAPAWGRGALSAETGVVASRSLLRKRRWRFAVSCRRSAVLTGDSRRGGREPRAFPRAVREQLDGSRTATSFLIRSCRARSSGYKGSAMPADGAAGRRVGALRLRLGRPAGPELVLVLLLGHDLVPTSRSTSSTESLRRGTAARDEIAGGGGPGARTPPAKRPLCPLGRRPFWP